MGGQACVFYGAAEFSRDLDLLVLADPENLNLLRVALDDLQAETIAVPPFDSAFLAKGHAIHFRCHRADVLEFRIDVMSQLRDGPEFEELWDRRTTIEVEDETVELMSLEDLVKAKKTQCDKDWPMIARLLEQRYFRLGTSPGDREIEFLLMELRTPELLVDLSSRFPGIAARVLGVRPAVAEAIVGDIERVRSVLNDEEAEEKRRDREYWRPLRTEPEQLRHARLLRDRP